MMIQLLKNPIVMLLNQNLSDIIGIERYYIIFLLNPEDIKELTRINFRELHSTHWGIECYHRAIKQLCGIKRFLVRTTEAILTHFFCSLRAFTH
jgi:hypothetical protein